MKILHIVTHLGGGIGTVLINWAIADKGNQNVFMCLGYNYASTTELCKKNKIELYNDVGHGFIHDGIVEMNPDVVILHYWNHPLLVDFMVKTPLPPCRLVVYSHIAGRSAPYVIPEKIYDYADMIVHSSITSKNADESNTIMSTGGVSRFEDLRQEKHDDFNILYIGTLDFSKLRSDFVDICQEISKRIDDSRFIICGTGDSVDIIKNRASELGLSKRFVFTGLIEDVREYLKTADVFLYPLTENHYGTGEQVIGEAMVCGVVPIVFNNPCESSIVENLKNGLIVGSVNDCIEAIVKLRNDTAMRLALSSEAKETAKEIYSLARFISKWGKVIQQAMAFDKRARTWEVSKNFDEGVLVLIESLGGDGKLFSDYIGIEKKVEEFLSMSGQWKSKSKGSIYQYLKHFPNDKYLNRFRTIIEGDKK